MYPAESGSILQFIGYDSDNDFDCAQDPNTGDISIIWTGAGSAPTAADIAAQELPWRRSVKLGDAKQEAQRRVDLIMAEPLRAQYMQQALLLLLQIVQTMAAGNDPSQYLVDAQSLVAISNQAAAIRTAENSLIAAIEAAADTAAISAIDPTDPTWWPA